MPLRLAPRSAPPARGRRVRASSSSPTASMISTYAGRRPARVERLGCLADHPADRRRRRVLLALGQAEQGEARLRLPPGPARVTVRLLGLVELALEPMDLPLAVERLAVRRPGSSPAAAPARRASSRASGQAPSSCRISARWIRQRPVKRHEVGLLRAPARQGRRPFAGPARARTTRWQASITPQ